MILSHATATPDFLLFEKKLHIFSDQRHYSPILIFYWLTNLRLVNNVSGKWLQMHISHTLVPFPFNGTAFSSRCIFSTFGLTTTLSEDLWKMWKYRRFVLRRCSGPWLNRTISTSAVFTFYILFFCKRPKTHLIFGIIRPKLIVYYFNCPGTLDSGILELHCDSTDVPVNAEKRQHFTLTERPLTDMSLKHRQEALPLWSQRSVEDVFIEKAKTGALIKNTTYGRVPLEDAFHAHVRFSPAFGAISVT